MSNKRYSRAELRTAEFEKNGGKKERIAGGTVYTIANKENAKIKEIKPGYYGSKKYCPYCGSWYFVKSNNVSELSLYDCTCGALFTGEYVTKYVKTK